MSLTIYFALTYREADDTVANRAVWADGPDVEQAGRSVAAALRQYAPGRLAVVRLLICHAPRGPASLAGGKSSIVKSIR